MSDSNPDCTSDCNKYCGNVAPNSISDKEINSSVKGDDDIHSDGDIDHFSFGFPTGFVGFPQENGYQNLFKRKLNRLRLRIYQFCRRIR